MSRPLVIVSGAMANKHRNGGEAWARLNWILGLRRLGCDVCFVEQIDSQACVGEAGGVVPFAESANLSYFRRVAEAFDLTESSSLLCDEGREYFGLTLEDVVERAAAADALINVSGHLGLDAVLRVVRRKVFVDLDPGFTQIWHAQGLIGDRLARHDAHLTVGENVGTTACAIPTNGVRWRPKRRFFVPDQWPRSTLGDPGRLTTVASWRGDFGRVEYGGRAFGLKVHEFRKLLSLPLRAPQTFEIALNIHADDEADRLALGRHAWKLVDPRTAAADPLAFRDYVRQSGGECSAAQGIYVETNSGWLSDRTVRYLASGKPALVQDTGFGRNVPVGEGLVPFRTLDEAIAGARWIARDYERHAGAARHLAETYFSADVVLPPLIEHLGIRL